MRQQINRKPSYGRKRWRRRERMAFRCRSRITGKRNSGGPQTSLDFQGRRPNRTVDPLDSSKFRSHSSRSSSWQAVNSEREVLDLHVPSSISLWRTLYWSRVIQHFYESPFLFSRLRLSLFTCARASVCEIRECTML